MAIKDWNPMADCFKLASKYFMFGQQTQNCTQVFQVSSTTSLLGFQPSII